MRHREAWHRIISLTAGILIVLLLASTITDRVSAQEDDRPLAPVEVAPPAPVDEWVRDKVSRGEPADLQEYSPNEGDRVLSAEFLRSLLVHPPKQGDQPPSRITVRRANVRGPLIVQEFDLPFSVMLHDSRFDDTVDFDGSVFQGDLSLRGSTFEDLRLPRVVTEGSLVLDGARIGLWADLSQARVGRELSVQDVRFLEGAYEGNFSRMHVEGRAFFNRSHFRGTVRFYASTIQEDLEVGDATFFFSHDSADFDRIRVNRSVRLRRTTFERQASFRSMTIANNFDAEGSAYYGADFSNALISNDLSLPFTTFSDSIDMRFANIGGNVDLTGAALGGNMQADFSKMKLIGDLNLERSRVRGPLTCRNSVIGRDIKLEAGQFVGGLDCSSVRVGGMVVLDRATLEHEVSFVDSTVDGVFQARSVAFNGAVTSLDLSRIAVKRAIDIDGSTFAGRLGLTDADVMDLKVRTGGASLKHLDLSGVVVGRDLILDGWSVDRLDAPSLQIVGRAVLTDVGVNRQANLQGARLGRVEVKNVRWPSHLIGGDEGSPPNFLGAYFESYSSREDDGTSADFTEILARADFSRSAYASWESYLRQLGDASKADTVMIAMRTHARNKLYPEWRDWMGPLPWIDFATQWLTGYGRRPWNAFIPALIVVAVGAVIFGRGSVDPLQAADKDRRFDRLLFSLDKFMPVINLKVADVWRVKDCPTWIWWYQYVHTLLGWTIVPFIVATLTGIIK